MSAAAWLADSAPVVTTIFPAFSVTRQAGSRIELINGNRTDRFLPKQIFRHFYRLADNRWLMICFGMARIYSPLCVTAEKSATHQWLCQHWPQ